MRQPCVLWKEEAHVRSVLRVLRGDRVREVESLRRRGLPFEYFVTVVRGSQCICLVVPSSS